VFVDTKKHLLKMQVFAEIREYLQIMQLFVGTR